MERLRVNLGPRSYDIRFGDLAGVGMFARAAAPNSTQALIVADGNVTAHAKKVMDSLAASGFRTAMATVLPGEASKSFSELQKLYDALAAIPADRQTLVVAVGGGMVGDLAGFAAATYNRGLPLLMVPTTLLAMVDSSVGGKVGINHSKGKNLIGAFHQPIGVWIDAEMLKTLPSIEFNNGMAEVIKYGVILNSDLFNNIEKANNLHNNISDIILHSCRIKATVVEIDEYDISGKRAILNFGHTFGHAFEVLGNYSNWRHGEAVAAGMVYESRIALKMRRIDQSLLDRLVLLLKRFQLPVAKSSEWNTDNIIHAMRTDKKIFNNQFRFVLPDRLGHGELVDNVPEALVREVLASS